MWGSLRDTTTTTTTTTAMVKHMVGESAKKQLKPRSGSGRGVGRLGWKRWFIEGPCRRHEHWPQGAECKHQGHTNCRLLLQRCSSKPDGSALVLGEEQTCSLWLEPGRQQGAGHGRRLDLRCRLRGILNPWGERPNWARVIAFYFGNHKGLSLEEYQSFDSQGRHRYEPDHLPLPAVPLHLRHRYCLAGHLEVVTRQENAARRAAEVAVVRRRPAGARV